MKMGFIQLLTFRPLPALASAMKLSQPQPNLKQQKTEKTKAPMGSRLVLTMKSQKSSQADPSAKGWKWKALYPRAVVRARRKMPAPQTTQPLGRLQPVISRTQERMFSNTASSVEKAAKTMNRKNSVPQTRPPDMLLNTVAMVSNRREGPAFTSMP